MVQREGTTVQAEPAMPNNIEHNNISHTLAFYVNGKEVCKYCEFYVK